MYKEKSDLIKNEKETAGEGLSEQKEALCAKMSFLLPELRHALHLSQTALGEYVSVSRQTISETERGEYHMSWNQFASFYLLFGANRSTHEILEENNLGIRSLSPVLLVSGQEQNQGQTLE